jgi:hypothetical protein
LLFRQLVQDLFKIAIKFSLFLIEFPYFSKNHKIITEY